MTLPAFIAHAGSGPAHAEPSGPPAAPESGSEGRKRPQRTCVGCRSVGDPAGLVRLILTPDGEVVPDLAGRARGRGAWVHPRADCLGKAVPAGLARSFKTPIQTPVSRLHETLVTAANRRISGLVSAAWRAQKLAIGSDAVKEALTAGRASLVMVAGDARAAAEMPCVLQAVAAGRAAAWGTKEELGVLTGRSEVGVLAVLDEGLAEALSFVLQMAHMPAPENGSRKRQRGTSTEV